MDNPKHPIQSPAAIIDPDAHGAVGDGATVCTAALQRAIDAAAAVGGGMVLLRRGAYLTGSLFLKSHVELRVEEGCTLIGIQEQTAYPSRWTRIAGFELNWPCALINVCGQENVRLSGRGIIDGRGDYWWRLFWGEDCRGGIRAEYEKRGLRWAADYDCERPRLIQVYDSCNVSIEGLNLQNPGFWTVHLCYSKNVRCAGLTIRANLRGIGPSSDGIDIDSSSDILVEDCDIDCNDDNLCLKAGRDADGLRVNRPTENVVIRNCVTRSGHGMITLGSETSGGFKNIEVHGLRAVGTRNGIRFKSARIRGGFAENVLFRDIVMERVDEAFAFELNWFPSYSYPSIPDTIAESEIKPAWRTIVQRVQPASRGIPDFHHLHFKGIDVRGAKLAFRVEAYPEKPLHDLVWENVSIRALSAGYISHARNWNMQNVSLYTEDGSTVACADCTDVDLPVTSHPAGASGADRPTGRAFCED